jgi:hypothetical protein
MNESERFLSTKVFIAALQSVLAEEVDKSGAIPFDPESFAKTAQELAGKGNGFANKFPVFRTVAGPGCPDFQEGMTLAQSAGLISRQNPSQEAFWIKASRRQLRFAASVSDFQAATDFARDYLKRTAPSSQP